MLLLFLKAEQLGLFDTPTYVHGHVRKDGTQVAPHMALRKRRVAVSSHPAPAAPRTPRLNAFVEKHGGAAHLRATLGDMTPEQRGKLIDAMAHMDDVHTADVIKVLGLHEPDPAVERVKEIEAKGEHPNVTPAEDLVAEHKELVHTLETPAKADDAAEAKEQGSELKEYEKEAQGEPQKDEPGDKGAERLAQLRERRDPERRGDPAMEEVDARVDAMGGAVEPAEPATEAAPNVDASATDDVREPDEPDSAPESIDDREDLRDAVIRDPHSPEVMALIRKIAASDLEGQKKSWADKAMRRLRWAEAAERKADALVANHNRDPAFLSQPGHLPARAKQIAQADRSYELRRRAGEHRRTAEELLRLAARNKGDAEATRQAARDAMDEVKPGDVVNTILYGPREVVRVNKKTFSVKDSFGGTMTVDKAHCKPARRIAES